MGSYGGRFQWSITVWILVINAVCFLLQGIADRSGGGRFISEYIALSADGVLRGFVWQLVTFQFLHGSFTHILFNSLGIFFIGRAVERFLAPDKFVFLYLFSGVVGGMFQVLWLLAMGSSAVSTVGASAGLFGFLAAFAIILGHETITLMLFLILPVSFQGRYLLPIGLAVSLLGMLWDKSNVGHASHLGGMLGALFYLNYLEKKFSPMDVLKKFIPGKQGGKIITGTNFRKASRRGPVRTARVTSESSRSPKASPSASASSIVPAEEIDRILDKITEKGIHSLTPDERKKLENHRADLNKRH